MAKTVKDMVAEASAVVPRISQQDAADMVEKGAVLLDIREPGEVVQSGKADRRGDDPQRPFGIPGGPVIETCMTQPWIPEKPVILYCAVGGRAALAGQTLKDLGYKQVYNLGGFKDWVGGQAVKVE